MISKTVRDYRRKAISRNYGRIKEYHVERVIKQTWWFLWVIPLYSTEYILSTNI